MKKAFLSGLILNLIVISGFSQDIISVGMGGGTSNYLGDYNKTNPFYAPSPSYGGIIKNDFGLRTSMRFSLFYENLRGSTSDFIYLNTKPEQSFNKSFVDMSIALEYNFLPYEMYNVKKDNFSPFVFAGVGMNYFFNSEKNKFPFTIPFGLGIKYNIFERFSIGIEWSARKLFTDTMDGVLTVYDSENKPIIHNNDWYHMTFVFFTFKPFREKIECPAYDD
ncbi:MAG: DUF6089 family protein [Bacteroidota bacterium]